MLTYLDKAMLKTINIKQQRNVTWRKIVTTNKWTQTSTRQCDAECNVNKCHLKDDGSDKQMDTTLPRQSDAESNDNECHLEEECDIRQINRI